MCCPSFSCSQAKKIDLVEYLKKLGYSPSKIRNHDYWYLSPFRNEKEASFKVNRRLNTWYDFAEGVGGTLIDFGIRYHKCSIQDFLKQLSGEKEIYFSFPQQGPEKRQKQANVDARIIVTDCRPIADPGLRQYLHQRSIPLIIANRLCSEIEFSMHGNKFLAIGFKNNQGGYELRNEHFKGSSSPKSFTWIKNNPEHVVVFEGFFDFLSFQTQLLFDRDLVHALPNNQGSYLVLNSLAFFEKNRQLMEEYPRIQLFLDRDDAGFRLTSQALHWSENYQDMSGLYSGFKDLNEYHIRSKTASLSDNRLPREGL